MTTSYPTSLDAFTNPTSGDNLSTSVGGRTHSAMHADMNDAMEAVQAALGVAAWQTYTPTITGPNIGSTGTRLGRYKVIGKVLIGTADIVFNGSGIAAGSGNYTITLPATAAASAGSIWGAAVINRGGVYTTGATYYNTTTDFIVVTSAGILSNSTPTGTFSASNFIRAAFTVELA